MDLNNKPLLTPMEREYRAGHEDDPQHNGVLPLLKWIVFWRTSSGQVIANFFVHENKARDFAQEQNLREYLREVHGC